MSYLKFTVSSLLLVFLVSCFGPPTPDVVNVDRTDDDYVAKKAQDDDRDEVIRRRVTTIQGDKDKCEDKDKSHECYDQCDDIYRSRGDREDCEELTVAQVDALADLYEILEDPEEDELSEIYEEDFDVYLNVSIRSFDDLIEDYSSSDAKEILIWLIDNEDIAKIFEKEDDNYKSFESLLKQFNGNYNSNTADISEPFLKKLDDDKLLEEAMVSDFMLEWFQDYINEKNTACSNDAETRACFAVYCKIGHGIDDDARDDWLDFSDFEGYIDDIIDEKVNSQQGTGNNRNASGWIHADATGNNDREIEDVGDIDNWVDDLCQGLSGGTASGGGGSGGGSSSNNQPTNTWPTLCNTVAERKTEATCSAALKTALKATGQGAPTSDQSANAFLWIIQKDSRVKAVFLKTNGDLDLTSAGAYVPFLKKIGGTVPGTPTALTTKAFFNIELARNKPNQTLAEVIINEGSNQAFQILFEDYIFDTSQHTCSGNSNSFGDNEKCFKTLICGIALQFSSKNKIGGKWLERTYNNRLKNLLQRVKTYTTRPGYVKTTLTKATKINKKWITLFCKP